MKFNIMADQLDRIVTQLNSIVNNQPVTQIDNCVLIEVGSSAVNFTSTDRFCELKFTVPILSQEEGKIAVKVGRLGKIAKVLKKGEPCELVYNEERSVLNVSAGDSNFDLQTLPPDDFPQLANDEYDSQFEVSVPNLIDSLNRTKFAVAREDQRQFLTGVHFNLVEKEGMNILDAVATDGFRMAIVSKKAPEGLTDFPGIVIAEKSATTITRTFSSSEKVTVSYTPQKICLEDNGIKFTSLLLVNDYPDYARLIPSDSNLTLSVDVKSLLAGLREVLTISDDTREIVSIDFAQEVLTMRVAAMGQGQAQTKIKAEYSGDHELSMRFIGIHLTGILEVMAEGTAKFTLNDKSAAIKITKEGDDSAVFVVMPQKT